MKRSKIGALILVGVLGVVATGLSACEEKKGPVERAGEKVDNAIEKAKDKVD